MYWGEYMKSLFKVVSLSLMTCLLSAQIFAGISISPVQLYLTDKSKQRSATFTLESKGDDETPRIFEAKAFKWTQNAAGEDILSPESNIIINPKNFILKPKSKQMVRVGFTQSVESMNLQQEEAWRIIYTELPQVTNSESKIALLLSINVPFFVGKQEPAYLKFIAKKMNGRTIIQVENLAKSHIQIQKLYVIDKSKKTVAESSDMKYLLALGKNQYDIGNVSLQGASNYKVVVETDKGDTPLEFNLVE